MDNKTFIGGPFESIFREAADSDGALPQISRAAADGLLTQAMQMLDNIVSFKELMMMYTCAMKEIRTKFDVLNTEFNLKYKRNPINFISTRLKQSASIAEKLVRLGLPVSIENLENSINDIAGVRVVCSYVDDVFMIAEALKRQDDITLIAEKDYITNPKPNGYRSLHLIVSVPVFFAEKSRKMKVEVQVRTIAMDFWASLEHQLKYKNSDDYDENIVTALKSCADTIAQTDARMLTIRKCIDSNHAEPSEEEQIFEKLMILNKRID